MKHRLTLTGEQETTLAREPIETSHSGAPENTASSEFTQMFGALQSPVPSDAPFAQPAQSGGLTDIFAAHPKPTPALDQQKAEATPEPAAQQPVPFSEAPTQSFAAIPPTPAVHGTAASNDETVIFRPGTVPQPAVSPMPISSSAVPVSVATPQPASPQPANPAQSAGEFTQIFTPLAPPSVPPPAPSAPRTPEASGEFTQFFSAISARQGTAAAPQAKAAPAQVARPHLSSPAQPAAPQTPIREADVFSQMFREVQAPGAPQPAPARLSHPSSSLSSQEGSAFTQLFSQPATLGPAAAAAPAVVPSAPAFATPSDPIFGSAAPRGSFTDVFAAQPPTPAPSGSAFTELFRGMPPSNASSQPVPPQQSPAANAFAPPVPSAAPAGGGEFTRLMQQLERPASASAPAPQAPPVNAAWFNPPATASAGESEYTRVMRGGALSAAQGAEGGFPNVASAGAPGFSQAPSKSADKEEPPAGKQKPKTWIIALVAANVVLLVALIVLGILLLHHK